MCGLGYTEAFYISFFFSLCLAGRMDGFSGQADRVIPPVNLLSFFSLFFFFFQFVSFFFLFFCIEVEERWMDGWMYFGWIYWMYTNCILY